MYLPLLHENQPINTIATSKIPKICNFIGEHCTWTMHDWSPEANGAQLLLFHGSCRSHFVIPSTMTHVCLSRLPSPIIVTMLFACMLCLTGEVSCHDWEASAELMLLHQTWLSKVFRSNSCVQHTEYSTASEFAVHRNHMSTLQGNGSSSLFQVRIFYLLQSLVLSCGVTQFDIKRFDVQL